MLKRLNITVKNKSHKLRAYHDVQLKDDVVSKVAATKHNNQSSNQEVNRLPDSQWVVIKLNIFVGVLILLCKISKLNLIVMLSQKEVNPDRESNHYKSVRYHQEVRKVATPSCPGELVEIDHHSKSQLDVRRHAVVYQTVPE
jgi:hypothetical protein